MRSALLPGSSAISQWLRGYAEDQVHSIDHVLKMRPKLIGVLVVLMRGHVVFDLATRQPVERGFEIVLPHHGGHAVGEYDIVDRL